MRMDDVICHVAIADDWEMSRGFGVYEVATRNVPLEPGDHVRATTADGVDAVVAERYADLTIPLVRIDLSVAGLRAAGVEVRWSAGGPQVLGGIPMDPDVVLAETPISPRR